MDLFEKKNNSIADVVLSLDSINKSSIENIAHQVSKAVMEGDEYAITAYIKAKALEEIASSIQEKIKSYAVEEAEILREAEKSVLALKFEHVKENGHQVVLAYGKNNKFLGQGLTEEDAAKNIQLSYPKHRILIVNEKATITKVLDPLDIKSV